MRDIHPHWEADEPVEVRVKDRSAEQAPVTPEASEPTVVSRRPAAIVGMLAVLALGYGFFQGVDSLTGQVTPSGPSVRITDTGIVPASLNVEHGQTVTFVNETVDEHRIESGTLCSDTGYCLQTGVLNAGQSATFTITPDMRSGTYDYASVGSAELRGSIVIVTETVDDFTDLSSVLQDSFLDEIRQNPVPSAPAPTTFVAAAGTLPRNPYTVGSERLHPFDGEGDPIPEAFGDTDETVRSAATTAAQTTFAQTRGPLRQPETGAGVWIVVVCSILVLWRVTKHHFAVRY